MTPGVSTLILDISSSIDDDLKNRLGPATYYLRVIKEILRLPTSASIRHLKLPNLSQATLMVPA